MRKILIALAAAIVLAAAPVMAATNLNTATQQQLEALKGIGPSKAKAIIEYRQKNGDFKSVQDLNKVPGFGDKTVARLAPELSLTGETTAPAKAASNSKMMKSPAAPAQASNAAPAQTAASNSKSPAATPASAMQSNSKMPANSTSAAPAAPAATK